MGLQTTGTGLSGQSGENIQADFVSLSSRALAYLATVIGDSAPLKLTGTDPNSVPLTVEGAPAQVSSLVEFNPNSGSGARINANGSITIPDLGTNVQKLMLGLCNGNAGISIVGNNSGFFSIDTAGNDFMFRMTNNVGRLLFDVVGSASSILLQTESVAALELDKNATADETKLLIWDITAGTLKRVSRGVAGSGGAGFRVLRIPN